MGQNTDRRVSVLNLTFPESGERLAEAHSNVDSALFKPLNVRVGRHFNWWAFPMRKALESHNRGFYLAFLAPPEECSAGA